MYRPGTTQSPARSFGGALKTLGAETATAAGRIVELHETAKTDLVEVPKVGSHSLTEAAAAILARSAGSMSIERLRAELSLGRSCYAEHSTFDVSVAKLTTALRAHDAFVHGHRG